MLKTSQFSTLRNPSNAKPGHVWLVTNEKMCLKDFAMGLKNTFRVIIYTRLADAIGVALFVFFASLFRRVGKISRSNFETKRLLPSEPWTILFRARCFVKIAR